MQLLGVTTQSYVPVVNGYYTVIVTDVNGCVDTSACANVVITDVNDIENALGIKIYPNPNTGKFTIEKSKNLSKDVYIKLLDETSRLIVTKVIPVDHQKVDVYISNYSKGIYFLQLFIDDVVYVKQILKD